MPKIAFIGLGIMGYPMAGHLAHAGHDVTVYNRTNIKAEKWTKEFKGKLAATPFAAAQNAEFVFTCVGNDNDLRSVILGKDGAFEGMKPDSVFADHTTASADVARELYSYAKQRKIHFLDAPVSGGQGGAQNGTLTIMVGGDHDIFSRAEPIMRAYGKNLQHLGPSGAGQLTKMVNQICIAGLIQALAEGINFAKAANLDCANVIAAISKGAAGSWQMDNRGLTMAEGKFDFGFAVDLMRKDLGICLAEAKRNGASLPITELIDKFYSDVQVLGGNRLDTSSLILRLNKKTTIS